MAQGGRHLTFELCGQSYALNIEHVREIIPTSGSVHPIPDFPESIKGIMNLRGEIVPVMDICTRLHMPVGPKTGKCIIVTESCGYAGVNLLGFAVDKVNAVEEYDIKDISPAPKVKSDQNYLDGVYRAGGQIVIIIDPIKLLTDEIVEAVEGYVSENS